MRGKGKCLSALCAMPDHPAAFVGRRLHPGCCSAGAVELAFEGKGAVAECLERFPSDVPECPTRSISIFPSVRGSFLHKIW